jgi:type IV secretory pathway VirB4 component
LNDIGGIYYGINKLSQNPIIANRKALPAGHGMILGRTGSGKSVYSKCEIISNRCIFPEDNIIIIDPQNEYKKVANIPGIEGTIVSFDSKDNIYVNPLDVNFDGVDYSTLKEIIADKTDFILTLLSSCMRRELDAGEEGVIDKVVDQVYSENYAIRKKLNGGSELVTEFSVPSYMVTNTTELPIVTGMSQEEQERVYSPTLQDIYQKLKDMENDPVALKLAAHMQIFVNGSLNHFNHKTNINLNNKFLVFNIMNPKENLLVTSMLVMLEIIKNKMRANFRKGEWTHIYIDEFHELLGIPAVSDYVLKLWKEARKFYGTLTGITQNMTDLINNSPDSARLTGIFNNTQYFAFLNQSTTDREILIKLLPSISPAMFNYVEGAAQGTGLIMMGGITVPFDSRMSKDCELYSYVNTD